MPRKGHIQKRDVLADPVYKNKIVTKLINNIMLDGKKGVAQKIVYGAFEQVAEQTGKDALEVFDEAMNNVMPELEVKARRIGGSTYQVPIEVRPDRRQAMDMPSSALTCLSLITVGDRYILLKVQMYSSEASSQPFFYCLSPAGSSLKE